MSNPVRTLATAAALLIFAGALIPGPRAAAAGAGHQFRGEDCALCHGGEEPGKAWAFTSPGEDISPKCVNCHGPCDVWSPHEGMAGDPSAMKRDLPLGTDGAMACVTCHGPHGPEGGEERGSVSAMLRIGNLKRELCLACHSRERNDQWSVAVASPPERAVVYEDYVPLLGSAEGFPGDHLEIRVNGASFPLKVQNGTFHTRLRVQEGLNSLEVFYGKRTLWKGEIFNAGEEDGETTYAKAFYGHQTDTLEECFGCHRQREGLLRADTATPPDLCYGCHEPFDGKRYLHGPIAVGDCLTCHDPHGGSGPAHLRSGEVDLCRTCHGDNEVFGHDGGRRAVAEGSCSVCHDPHQSDSKFLRKTARL